MNPMNLMQMFQNPQQFMQNIMGNSQIMSNPMAQNAVKMMKKGLKKRKKHDRIDHTFLSLNISSYTITLFNSTVPDRTDGHTTAPCAVDAYTISYLF